MNDDGREENGEREDNRIEEIVEDFIRMNEDEDVKGMRIERITV